MPARDAHRRRLLPRRAWSSTCAVSGLEDALDALERYLESAYLAGLPFVRIIHGKGTGRLRQVIREELAKSAFVTDLRIRQGERRRRRRHRGADRKRVVFVAQISNLRREIKFQVICSASFFAKAI